MKVRGRRDVDWNEGIEEDRGRDKERDGNTGFPPHLMIVAPRMTPCSNLIVISFPNREL
jgi:hypothetical protein